MSRCATLTVENPNPQIIDLKMLDTDFAQLVEVDPLTAQLTVLIGKQIYGYCRVMRQDQRDNILCQIATSAELFTAADLEVIDDRTRETGFSLQEDERQFILDWLKCEFKIDLEVQR